MVGVINIYIYISIGQRYMCPIILIIYYSQISLHRDSDGLLPRRSDTLTFELDRRYWTEQNIIEFDVDCISWDNDITNNTER